MLCPQEGKKREGVNSTLLEDLPACKFLDKFHDVSLWPLPLLPSYQGSSLLFKLLNRLLQLEWLDKWLLLPRAKIIHPCFLLQSRESTMQGVSTQDIKGCLWPFKAQTVSRCAEYLPGGLAAWMIWCPASSTALCSQMSQTFKTFPEIRRQLNSSEMWGCCVFRMGAESTLSGPWSPQACASCVSFLVSE